MLSHGAPSTHRLNPEVATGIAQRTNDRLKQSVDAHPDRFAAFACLPTPDPKGAADELERAVKQLGFVGAMVHGLTYVPDGPAGGLFLDDQRFWPIFERAAALDVPIYLHPAAPHPAVTEAYYKDYVTKFPGITSASWGFTVETCTMAVRMCLSGVFDQFPNLHQLFWEGVHGAGDVKKSLDTAVAEKLLATIDEISDIFWQTEKAKGMGVYPPA